MHYQEPVGFDCIEVKATGSNKTILSCEQELRIASGAKSF